MRECQRPIKLRIAELFSPPYLIECVEPIESLDATVTVRVGALTMFRRARDCEFCVPDEPRNYSSSAPAECRDSCCECSRGRHHSRCLRGCAIPGRVETSLPMRTGIN